MKKPRTTKIAKALRLRKHDHILTAWAENASGPGWANTPLWVVIVDGDGRLRRECLQPDEQPAEVRLLYSAHAAITGQITTVLRRAVNRG